MINCPKCKNNMKSEGGSGVSNGQDFDFQQVWCPCCGYTDGDHVAWDEIKLSVMAGDKYKDAIILSKENYFSSEQIANLTAVDSSRIDEEMAELDNHLEQLSSEGQV